MDMMNETSKPEAADPVCVSIGRALGTSNGSVAFSGLEKGIGMDKVLATCLNCEYEWVEVFWKGPDGTYKKSSLEGELICPECKSEDIDILGYSKVSRG